MKVVNVSELEICPGVYFLDFYYQTSMELKAIQQGWIVAKAYRHGLLIEDQLCVCACVCVSLCVYVCVCVCTCVPHGSMHPWNLESTVGPVARWCCLHAREPHLSQHCSLSICSPWWHIEIPWGLYIAILILSLLPANTDYFALGSFVAISTYNWESVFWRYIYFFKKNGNRVDVGQDLCTDFLGTF